MKAKVYEVVLMGNSRLVRTKFGEGKARPEDYEMRPMSIRALFIPAEKPNYAMGIAARRKRIDERITTVRVV
jgi:hypothetical protein